MVQMSQFITSTTIKSQWKCYVLIGLDLCPVPVVAQGIIMGMAYWDWVS